MQPTRICFFDRSSTCPQASSFFSLDSGAQGIVRAFLWCMCCGNWVCKEHSCPCGNVQGHVHDFNAEYNSISPYKFLFTPDSCWGRRHEKEQAEHNATLEKMRVAHTQLPAVAAFMQDLAQQKEDIVSTRTVEQLKVIHSCLLITTSMVQSCMTEQEKKAAEKSDSSSPSL